MKATDWKLGISCGISTTLERSVFENLAKSNVDMIEMSLTSAEKECIDWKAVKQASADTGVEIWSFHLPFAPFEKIDIAALDKDKRKYTLDQLSDYIKRSSEIGAKVMVVHPSAEPNSDAERAEKIKIAKDSLAQLAQVAKACGSTVAVEDLPRTCLGNCAAEIEDLISADENLRVCFDTNHLLTERNVDFVRKLGSKIITLHVSDYEFTNERHWMPYEGKINWVELVNALEDVNYCGPWMYELGLKAPASITRRDMTYDDMYKNYIACINKKTPEILGVPKLDVCMENAYYRTPIITE